MTFDKMELRPSLMRAIEDIGYTAPTPIQKQAIPPALSGSDVMGLAQTGTGKTAAFALPILQRLSDGPRGKVRALVVAPTRELAGQIHDAFGELGRHTKLKSIVIYGGVAMGPQITSLRRGADIIVACPGRLLDHISRRNVDLSHVEALVLDEADRMFDMGFLPDIKKIIACVPAKRQTLLFSATMPDDIRGLANDILRDPVTAQVKHTAPLVTVSHALYPVEQHQKTDLLIELLSRTDKESVLVFTRTKHRAKKLAEQLGKEGYKTADLQGNLSQNKRQAALDGFKGGKIQILVATDIAARGIDVSTVSHVINYDMPACAETYTHRIGRTGRMEKTGDAYTLVAPEDGMMLRSIERLLGKKPEIRRLDGFDYDLKSSVSKPTPRGYRGAAVSAPAPSRPSGGRFRPPSRELKEPSPRGGSEGAYRGRRTTAAGGTAPSPSRESRWRRP